MSTPMQGRSALVVVLAFVGTGWAGALPSAPTAVPLAAPHALSMSIAADLQTVLAADLPPLQRAAALSHALAGGHAARLGVPLAADGAPSGLEAAWAAFLDATGGTAADADAARALLAAQPPRLQAGFAAVLGAFAAFHAAAAEAAGPPLDADEAMAALAARAPGHAAVLAARGALLDASVDLAAALARGGAVPGVAEVPGVLTLDLAGEDSVHEADVALLIDVGGRDVYRNNAGGASAWFLRPAAALIDLAGDDQYGAGRPFGANGGAAGGGAGFLLDAAGDDTYLAGHNGGNGGGASLGLGFLLDAQGNDRYMGDWGGVNGAGAWGGIGHLVDASGDDLYTGWVSGVNGGGNGGLGGLVDATGHDTYSGLGDSVNGGGSFDPGWGFLFDGAGNDRYANDHLGFPSGWSGVNGGAWEHGVGFLFDVAGDDLYAARAGAVNGGVGNSVSGGPSFGLLLDAGGRDTYVESGPGAGEDVTVVPKGLAGAQVDLPA